MGLAKRIIPVILHKNGQLVKGQKFVNDRVIGHALQAARIHAMRGVDELMILDVTASQEGREPNYALIESLAENCFSPITVGGGIKTAEHVKQLLRCGADKVCIYAAYRDSPNIIKELSDQFGSQCITVAYNHFYCGPAVEKLDLYNLFSIQTYGAGEVLLQYVDHDGTMGGYNLEFIKKVTEILNIPVIASGGCSGYEDMYQAIQCGADAVAAGALYAFTDSTPRGAAEYLASKGVEVRLT